MARVLTEAVLRRPVAVFPARFFFAPLPIAADVGGAAPPSALRSAVPIGLPKLARPPSRDPGRTIIRHCDALLLDRNTAVPQKISAKQLRAPLLTISDD